MIGLLLLLASVSNGHAEVNEIPMSTNFTMSVADGHAICAACQQKVQSRKVRLRVHIYESMCRRTSLNIDESIGRGECQPWLQVADLGLRLLKSPMTCFTIRVHGFERQSHCWKRGLQGPMSGLSRLIISEI